MLDLSRLRSYDGGNERGGDDTENLQDWDPLTAVGSFEHNIELVNSNGETRLRSYERWKLEEACFHFVNETAEETADTSWRVAEKANSFLVEEMSRPPAS